MNDKCTNRPPFLAFALVASLGVIIGILCAPKSGTETRKDLRDKIQKAAQEK